MHHESLPPRYKAIDPDTGKEDAPFEVSLTSNVTLQTEKGPIQVFAMTAVETSGACILAQSTGLPDRDGREIYACDIIMDPDGGIYRVEWKAKAACFVGRYFGKDWQPKELDWPLERIECDKVLGNCYESRAVIEQRAREAATETEIERTPT